MSGLITGLVLEHFPAESATDLCVALVLADAADHDGTNVYPSVGRVARLARVSDRTVQRSLQKFLAIGFLRLVRKGSGRASPNRYEVDVTWLRQQPSVFSGMGVTVTPFLGVTKGRKTSPEKVTDGRHGSVTQPCTRRPVDPSTIDQLVEAAVASVQKPLTSTEKYAAAIRARLIDPKRGPTPEDFAVLEQYLDKAAKKVLRASLPQLPEVPPEVRDARAAEAARLAAKLRRRSK